MRLLRTLLCFLLAVPVLADTVVFRNVTVIPMTSPKAMEKQTVVIKDGKIASIGKVVAVPKDATVIDGTGKFLLPGLADMHVKIPSTEAKGGMLQDVLTMLVANGVTNARGMWGSPGQLAIREKARAGKIVSPDLFLAGTQFGGMTVASSEEAIDRVRNQKKEGWDFLTIELGLKPEQYDTIAKTARESNMRFGGTVPVGVALPHAIESGQETIDYLDAFDIYLDAAKGPVDEKKLGEIASKIEEAGVWVVPMLALSEITYGTGALDALNAYPEVKYSPQAAVDVWSKSYELRMQNIPRDQVANVVTNNRVILRAFRDTGVRMLLGTAALEQYLEPGFSVMREMVALRNAGLTPYEILEMATVNPATYLGRSDIGTIETGNRADLVLLDADPLADVANVAKVNGVMLGGTWYSRQQLDDALKTIKEKYRFN
jgi:hypothetical protein